MNDTQRAERGGPSALGVYHGIPDGLIERPAHELVEVLGGPSLIYIRGRRKPPLFVSVLLHGNETSGWDALRRLLARNEELERELILFVGNVAAAARGARTLPHQQDYNRVWQGAGGPEGQMAAEVLGALDGQPLWAAVDLHNNNGKNPHYAIVTHRGEGALGLGQLFSDRAIWVEEPRSVLTRVFDELCPAVAVELGPVGDPACVDRAHSYLARCLSLGAIPAPKPERLGLHRTLARVHVAKGVPFSFADEVEPTPLTLTRAMESENFRPVAAGTEFGSADAAVTELLEVVDTRRQVVTGDYFGVEAGRILLKRSVIPAMYTTDREMIRQDCLCYFMEQMPLAPGGGSLAR